jgi:hypothetical protein
MAVGIVAATAMLSVAKALFLRPTGARAELP